ncbi:MAG: insulinase family protein, partial [Muribaculaceae bacterium]|nr:insulinase family protein [Muribaculaceae bacterium]
FFSDPEMQYPRVDFSIKTEKIPVEMRNTDIYFVNKLVERLISKMINNRLNEYLEKPECNYAYAGVRFGDFWVSKTMGAFDVTVIGKTEVSKAFNDAMGIIARACKTGFTESELKRAQDELMSYFDKQYNERNNTNNGNLGEMLYRHFIDNTPHPGFEIEKQMAESIFPMLQVPMINQAAASILTSENQVIVVSEPQTDGMEVIEEEQFVGNLENLINAEYEAYVDEVITDPMISKLPKPGKIKSVKAGPFETTELILSNGVKVYVKKTDFKADEILMSAFSNGGKRAYPASLANEIMFAEDAFNASKFGNFTSNMLRKYLAGKNVGIEYSIGNFSNTVDGSSTVKDIKYLFEMIYAAFTQLSADNETFDSQMQQTRTMMKAQESQPVFTFYKNLYKTLHNDNPLFNLPTLADLDKVNYGATLDFVKGTLSNAADYTFVFSGNVDLDVLKPLLEQYIATLPANAKKLTKVNNVTSLATVTGQVKDEWKEPMQAPATHVFNLYSDTNIPYTIANARKLEIIGSMLRNVLLETLREEEGGTYSPGAAASLSPITGEWSIQYSFQTNANQQDALIKRANEELMKLLANGTNAEAFNKAKEAALKQYENSIRTNSYWDYQLGMYLRGIDNITDGRSSIENLTLDELNSFMKTLYNGKNRIEVVMEGVPVEK